MEFQLAEKHKSKLYQSDSNRSQFDALNNIFEGH